MIDDVLEPIATIPLARSRRAKLAVVAVALAAVVAGGLAVATAGDKEPEPLALVAGDAAGFSQGERASGAPAPAVAPMAADSKMALGAPYWGGIEYQVQGDLPDLGDHATAWRVHGPDVDRATVARWAEALGMSGTPQFRDGSWVVESGDAFFNAYPGDGWSISFNRNSGERHAGDVSPADAERQARDLLARLGVLEGAWRVQVFETDIGVGYACAEDLKLRAAEEMARTDPDGTVSNDAGVASGPAASTIAPSMPSMPSMPDCPPPPPPVKAQNVSFFPVVAGERVEWSVWNVTIGAEGVENLYGNWVIFERGDDYKLRSVDAALEELRQGGRVVPMAEPVPMPTDAVPPVEPAVDPVAVDSVGAGTSGSAGAASGSTVSGSAASGSAGVATPNVVSEPPVAVDVAPARPAIAPYYPYPCPPEADCPAPEPQVVTITDVELVLQPQGVWSGRESAPKMFLVPAYRFTGTFKDGSAWESTVVALHPDAIAPPPAVAGVDVAPAKGTVATSAPVPPPVDMAPTTAPAKPPVR